jgi:hypothetical protein
LINSIPSYNNDQNVDESSIYNQVFTGILKSSPHPSVLLSILLFIHPQRQNDFYNLKGWGGYNNFSKRAINYINKYCIEDKNNLLTESDDNTWTFVLFQWLDKTSMINDKELTKVNNYFFGLLGDDRFAYEKIKQAWWGTRWSSESTKHWTLDVEFITLLDRKKLLRLLDKLTTSDKLRPFERKRVVDLIKDVTEKFNAEYNI